MASSTLTNSYNSIGIWTRTKATSWWRAKESSHRMLIDVLLMILRSKLPDRGNHQPPRVRRRWASEYLHR